MVFFGIFDYVLIHNYLLDNIHLYFMKENDKEIVIILIIGVIG